MLSERWPRGTVWRESEPSRQSRPSSRRSHPIASHLCRMKEPESSHVTQDRDACSGKRNVGFDISLCFDRRPHCETAVDSSAVARRLLAAPVLSRLPRLRSIFALQWSCFLRSPPCPSAAAAVFTQPVCQISSPSSLPGRLSSGHDSHLLSLH
jgi:hypothetical protein